MHFQDKALHLFFLQRKAFKMKLLNNEISVLDILLAYLFVFKYANILEFLERKIWSLVIMYFKIKIHC